MTSTSSFNRFPIPIVRRIIPSSASSPSSVNPNTIISIQPNHSDDDKYKQVYPGDSMKYDSFLWRSIKRKVYIPRVLLVAMMIVVFIAIAPWLDRNLNILCQSSIITPSVPEKKKEKNRYVIIAGPPKTASTSIQSNLYAWSESGLLGDWAWMHPNITCLRENCPRDAHTYLYNQAWFCKSWYCLSVCLFDALRWRNETADPCAQVKSCYNTESLQRHQKRNRPLKLVFGSEAIAPFYLALTINGKYPSKFIQGFVDTLPSSATKDEITFIVTYRSPRIDHLRSYWKDFAYHKKIKR